jgi:hypothetical protein
LAPKPDVSLHRSTQRESSLNIACRHIERELIQPHHLFPGQPISEPPAHRLNLNASLFPTDTAPNRTAPFPSDARYLIAPEPLLYRDPDMRAATCTLMLSKDFFYLKRGMYGVYQHVSETHLHRYLVEFDFRYSNREKLGVNDVARASRAKDERYERHRKRHWYLRADPRQLRLPLNSGDDQ